MKKLALLAGCAVLLSVLAGCRDANKGGEAAIKEDGQFPDFLVGTWKAQGRKWELTFDSDGSIPLIRHPFVTVPIDVAEGGAYEEGRDGAHSIYVMGLCSARYDQNKRELHVEIIIDYFKVVLPIGSFEGKMSDHITGPISEDGTTWTANWINYGELADSAKPEPNSVQPEPVVFTKVQTR